MTTSTSNMPSPTNTTPAAATSGYDTPAAPANTATTTEAKPEPTVDDFGYDIPPKEEVKPEPVEEVKPEPKEEVKPATGYDKELEPEVKPEPEAAPVDDKKSADLVQADADAILVDMVDKESISKFAMDNKFTKEQLQAYVNMKRSEDSALVEEHNERIKTTRNGWMTELKADPEFGGENFVKNVDSVEKVLEKFMPNTKKILTERGSMLPPYTMRDLLGLSKVLNPTTPLVNGDPSVPVVADKGNFLDEMYS